ncbi:unnamed protein product [Parascedosporium putredinis]|uniref:Uncharacterized protein n=1 Tax=Parascedosporium putredinis TaxID=1442378 RepID=A0A9P1H678_9PEZI|nr:unnamed protein product [Parascedosporium putredinis]CAI8000045.1 unnamed protein product [Parascedosporium putredinis]
MLVLTLSLHSGTPTSTTTSISALSTIAIKDGHRGHLPQNGSRHAHTPSTTSLEAERADRISRLAGLERVSTLRGAQQSFNSASSSPISYNQGGQGQGHMIGHGGVYLPAQHVTPSYFDAQGQPVAITKMSTVGTASRTGSYSGREDDEDDTRTTTEQDEDMLSMDNNYREGESIMSHDADGLDDDNLTNRSVGGYDDRMSDDGSASLVGFGEGAGSTISGPIYQRRPLPAMVGGEAGSNRTIWGIERTSSGLSEGRKDASHPTAIQERRAARMTNGVAVDGANITTAAADDDIFVDTTAREPVQVTSPRRHRRGGSGLSSNLPRSP